MSISLHEISDIFNSHSCRISCAILMAVRTVESFIYLSFYLFIEKRALEWFAIFSNITLEIENYLKVLNEDFFCFFGFTEFLSCKKIWSFIVWECEMNFMKI